MVGVTASENEALSEGTYLFVMNQHLFCILPVCWCLLAGCDGTDRSSVKGTVTVDGQPLDEGTINFLPLPGTKGPTAGSRIVDGGYSISGKGGTFPGKFRVEITATRPTGRQQRHPVTREPVEMLEQYLPTKYNTDSELEVEVEAGKRNRFDFPLQSR